MMKYFYFDKKKKKGVFEALCLWLGNLVGMHQNDHDVNVVI